MANLRTGKYGGQYYGSFPWESEPLTNAEMHVNAKYLYEVLHYKHGWTMNAVGGLLGNMQAESSINPGRWQSDNVQNNNAGYGLVQWTPATKYFAWCTEKGYNDPSEMDINIERIIYELDNKIQWYATSNYNFTFKEFSQSTMDAGTLAISFLLNYERPADQSTSVQNYRASLGDYWFNYLKTQYSGSEGGGGNEGGEGGGGSGSGDSDTPTPTPTPTKNKRLSKLLLYSAILNR